MILANNNARNIVCLSLHESYYDGVTAGSYSMTVIDDTTLQTYSGITITSLSTSAQTERFDYFYLDLTGSTAVNYSVAKIYLPNNSFYTYKIYKGTTEIETGILRVDGPPNIQTFTYSKSNTFVSYKN